MKLSIVSPQPGFHKELFDVADIFLGPVDRQLPGQAADLQIKIEDEYQQDGCTVRLRLSGAFIAEQSLSANLPQDALGRKRLHKRLHKLALFLALSQATGQDPPWGALTGIRPTRLLRDAMEEGQSLQAAVQQVQDTFFVSPQKADLLEQIVRVQNSLPQVQDGQIACYIGIPFCASRCRYCSFLSQVAGEALLEQYVKALLVEIEGTIRLMRAQSLTARSLYLGGGTPTVLSPRQLAQVLAAARPLAEQAQEITVEAGRPDSITRDKLQVIKDAGASRISVNPQTMHDSTLLAVGRRHTAQQALEAYALARQLGFGHINMDLIAGLPGEDLPMFAQSLDSLLALAPEALTVHSLALKRASDMHRLGDSLPAGQAVADMVDLAQRRAGEAGYSPYYLYRQKHMAGNLENVGYAKPGYACLYNIDMMEDQTTVLAMGAGAVSKLVLPGRKRILRSPNVKDAGHYIARVPEMLVRKQALFEGRGKGVRPSDPDEIAEE